MPVMFIASASEKWMRACYLSAIIYCMSVL